MQPVKNENRLLRVEEAARRLGISRSKVYELIQDRRLRSVHIDRSMRIPSKALEEFIQTLEGAEPQDAA